jgi:acetolactate synthase regulatory subunit
MSYTTFGVLVDLHDGPSALLRLLSCCHKRGWAPVSLRSFSDGRRCEVAMRLRVPSDRRGTRAQVHAQLARLADVECVTVDLSA